MNVLCFIILCLHLSLAQEIELFWVKLPTERDISARQHVGRAEWFFAPLDLPSGVVAKWKPAGKTH